MITFVSFNKPVTIGTHGRETWSRSQDALGSSGKITVQDKGSHLLFHYEAGAVKQRIKVPLTNICQVTEIDDPEEGKKP